METNREALFSQAWSLWDIQESLLQTYRSIFVSSQSVLLAMAVTSLTISSQGKSGYALILAIPAAYLLYLWISVCTARARDVTFAQFLIMEIEANDNFKELPLSVFKSFQNDGLSSVISDGDWSKAESEFEAMLGSTTRLVMNKRLPIVFCGTWLLVVGFAFLEWSGDGFPLPWTIQ